MDGSAQSGEFHPEVEPVSLKSIWELIKAAFNRWNEINAPRLGAALAFYTTLSIAPLLVLSIAIAGLVLGPKAAQGEVMAQVEGLVGREGGRILQSLLLDAGRLSSGLIAAVASISLLLIGASSVFGELRDSLNLVWFARNSTSSGLVQMIKTRFFSFALVLGIGFLLLVSLLFSAAIAAAGKFFGGFLPLPEGVLHLLNGVVSFASVTIFFGLLYKVVPDVRIEWRDVWIGAAVTAALFSIGKLLIGLYLGKAGVGSAYGAAGSVVVFLVWVYYSAQIFFLGAAFTQEFSERHGSRAQARAERPQTAPGVMEIRQSKLA
jgi:membrane protein